jgi:hypothetical protein
MINLDCYTYFPKVYEKHKLKQNALPNWITENTKKLDFFTNIYKNNIVVPLWSDMTLAVDAGGDVVFQLTEDDKYQHALKNIVSNIDYNELMFSNVILLELKSPWLIKADKDVMFHYNTLLWNQIKSVDKFWFLNKAFSFKEPKEIDLSFMITMKPGRQGIQEGTQIMQLLPLSEEEVKINHHLISPKEYERLKNNK